MTRELCDEKDCQKPAAIGIRVLGDADAEVVFCGPHALAYMRDRVVETITQDP